MTGVVDVTTAEAIDARSGATAPKREISRPLWLAASIKLIGNKEFGGARDNPVIINWAKDEDGAMARLLRVAKGDRAH